MLKMCRPGATINENIFEEDQDKFSEIWFEDVIHKTLESRRGIAETKWHDQELIMAFMSSESRLGNVDFLHANLVIAGAKIQLGEELRPIEFVRQIFNPRNGDFIFDC